MAGDIFKWRQTFDQYDEDQSGELSGEELKKMTEELWDMGSHSLELMQFMIEEADIDGDGQISWPEFCQMMQRMMDADEKKLEMKRQRTIINAQGTEVPTMEDTQKAFDGGMGHAKEMKWDVDLGVTDRESRAVLWRKLDYNGSNSCTFGEVEDGLCKVYPRLEVSNPHFILTQSSPNPHNLHLTLIQSSSSSPNPHVILSSQELIKTRKNGARIIMRAFLAADFNNPEKAAQQIAAGSKKLAHQKFGEEGDGLITRAEFPRFIAYVEFFANLWEHFAELDENGDGHLSRGEFEAAFLKIIPAEEHPDSQETFFEEQYQNCDLNGDAELSFDEFCSWIAEIACRKKMEAMHSDEQVGGSAEHKTIGYAPQHDLPWGCLLFVLL